MKKKLLVFATGLLVLSLSVAGCSSKKTTVPASVSPQSSTTSTTPSQAVNGADHPVKALKLDYDTLFTDPNVKAYAQKFIGKKAPDFTLKNLKGETIQLSKLKGQNVILELADTSCGACIKEEPILQDFKTKHPDQTVITVFPDNTNQQLKDFFKANNYKEDDSMIAGESNNTISQDYELNFTPTILFIDKNGYIAYVNIGVATTEELDKMTQLAF